MFRIPAARQGLIFRDFNTQQNMSKQTSMMAQDKAETTHSQLKQEAERCKLNILTQRGLIQGSITRFKKDIRNLHLSEENGLSVEKL